MPSPEEDKRDDAGGTGEIRVGGGPLGLLLPPDMAVLHEARRLISEANLRVEDLSICISQDPAIVIEFLKTANAMYFSAGRPPISTTQTAIVRLGSEVVLDILEKLKQRPEITDDDVQYWIELHRGRCRRVSIVATIISEVIAKQLSDDCQAVGVLMHVGDMLAVLHFGSRYVQLAEELSRTGINYRLIQDHKFDVEAIGVNYLRRNGVPENLLFAIERDSVSRAPERALMKPICMSASEMVDAFDAGRWEKIAPGKKIPPRSAIRLLGMSDTQYLRIYERVSEFLFGYRTLEERKAKEAARSKVEEAFRDVGAAESTALEDEIQNLLRGSGPAPEVAAPQPAVPTSTASSTQVEAIDVYMPGHLPAATFGLKTSVPSAPRQKRSDTVKVVPQLRTKKGNAVVGAVSDAIQDATRSEDLLRSLLSMLVDGGPFEKTALLVVSKDRRSALVVAARGPAVSTGQVIHLNDPLSPIAQCFSRVQSFGNKESECSPFGSKSFAVAPVDADHETPVALYADCGNNGSIGFEARRVFRNVVELLNAKLPQIPGGIPIELR